MTLTIEEIASMASVSRSTVSRVLNDHPSVRPAVRERVRRVIEERGYAPHAAARSLASRRTSVIALVIPRSAGQIFADPFFPQVIQGITEACNARRYFLMLSMLTGELERGFYQQIVRGQHFDGVIMLSSDVDDPILPLLVQDGTPLVLVGRHPYFDTLSWVDVENRDGAREAVSYLIGLGHTRIATITGPLQMAAAMDRRDGYKQALLEAGLPIEPSLMLEGDFTQEGGRAAMTRLLGLQPRPSAVFAAGDSMALGALSAIQEAGLSVPKDISLVGFDDLPGVAYGNPPLTTVRQPIYEIGAAAAALLIDRLEGGDHEPVQTRKPTQLVVRQSCSAYLG
jgi:LacI family transcriptional regulator